ncbi:MAG: SUMF1/EgtB/PvdO family nonheme iron enzyme, partial [Paenibacillaceae bacterium]|nr:SUMF1/EgtB/PvdO family nonheme iron enzyme [Paenibacillaceae bacterium]
GIAYTARITMYPKSGYTTVGLAANAYTVTGAVSSAQPQEQAIVTAVFSPTEDMVVVPAQSVTSVPLGVLDHIVARTFSPYVMGRSEMTYREWVETKQWASAYTFVSPGREGSAGIDGAPPTVAIELPVTQITWADALVWTNAHSERNGLMPVYRDAAGGVLRNAHTVTPASVVVVPNDGYRLPTSVEWEVASRWLGAAAPSVAPLATTRIAHAGLYWTPGTYASGAPSSTSDALSTQVVAQYTHTIASPMTSTASVRSKAPNALELYDMSGNVWEWVQDAIDGEPMMRGGGFRDLGSSIRIGHFATSTTAADDIGMRIVRSVHP